jgi:hypothetical protein
MKVRLSALRAGQNPVGRISLIENSSDLIGNRTHDLLLEAQYLN